MAGRKYGAIPEQHVARARHLRRRQTDAERRLWHRLRTRRLGGHKFRRQHSIGKYIVDFYCEDARLVIELDGGGHNEPQQKAYDKRRTSTLEQLGLTVLRFWNHELLLNTEQVLEVILEALENVPSPCPSPRGERGLLRGASALTISPTNDTELLIIAEVGLKILPMSGVYPRFGEVDATGVRRSFSAMRAASLPAHS